MKKVLTILASVSLFVANAAAHPECGTSCWIVGYTRCGDPIIATYEMVGRSRCGDPIYQWVTHYPEERSHYSSRDRDGDRHHDWDRDHDRDRYEHHHSYGRR